MRRSWRRCATRRCARKSARSACAPPMPDLLLDSDDDGSRYSRCLAAPAAWPAGVGPRAIARPWRAGARAGDLARRHAGASPAASTPRRSAGRCRRNAAEQVLRFHDGAVNAVAFLQDGRDRHQRRGRAHRDLDSPASRQPSLVLEGHKAPVVALAVSPDGATLASASWDHTARLWPLAGGAPRVIEGHAQNVNGVAFTPDGRALVTAGYDATLRIWPLAGGALADRHDAADAAQYGGGRARRRDRHRRRRRQGLFPLGRGRAAGRDRSGADADHRARGLARRQAHRRRRHPRLGRDHRPRHAQARAHAGRARPAGLVGRRSFPTAARCSPAAPTA